MSGKRIRLEVTPAQLRLINAGLALIEADPEGERASVAFIKRTRGLVWDAFDDAGVPVLSPAQRRMS